ncbi:MAG: pantoate--beta-alanine ligase [Owenweeksia sp.]|nr:pantoate--beta-alanine ligase [Owenweeksia sp.]
MALVGHATAQNDETVVSIFVNPTQFDSPHDLAKYPRHPERDIDQLRQTDSRIVFLPSVEGIIPER